MFRDFHTEFEPPSDECEAHECSPWKAIGDELVYSFRLRTRHQAGELLCRFLRVLRLHDRKLAGGRQIRLKGSAWIAGFPVRNRIVQLPVSSSARGDQARVDYWGPDIDIGFRLGPCSFPGMCVASLGLVELLAFHESANQVRFAHVGWETLKGVWEGRPYPIFWMELPADGPNGSKEQGDGSTRAFLHPWAEAESGFVARWNADGKDKPVKEAKDWKARCKEIRDSLPNHLGGVLPYIPGRDPIPPEDIEVLDLLNELSAGAGGSQVQKRATQEVQESLLEDRMKALEEVASPGATRQERDAAKTRKVEAKKPLERGPKKSTKKRTKVGRGSKKT